MPVKAVNTRKRQGFTFATKSDAQFHVNKAQMRHFLSGLLFWHILAGGVLLLSDLQHLNSQNT